MTIAYKLVDQDGYSRRGRSGETLWTIGSTVRPTGRRSNPCGPGVLHAYVSPEIAVFANPIHANIRDPRCLRVEADEEWENDGLKRWTTGACQVLGEVPLPVIATEERVAWAIVLAPHPATRDWAVGWLSGTDRSETAARAAEWAAWADAAAEAAWADAAAEDRLAPLLARARAILAGEFPAERFDDPLEPREGEEKE